MIKEVNITKKKKKKSIVLYLENGFIFLMD